MQKVRLAGVLLAAALLAAGCNQGVQRLDGDAAPAGVVTSHGTAAPPTTAAPTSSGSSSTPATPGPTSTPATPGPTSTPATPGTPAPRSPAAQPTVTTAPLPAPRVLGPHGLGALRLGMSRQQAEATGMIVGYRVEDFTGNCGISELRGTGVSVMFTPGVGLSNIPLYGGVRTPEGIRLGSSGSAVKKAYPGWKLAVGVGGNGSGAVDAPGNSNARYGIDLRDDKVSHLSLIIDGQKCEE